MNLQAKKKNEIPEAAMNFASGEKLIERTASRGPFKVARRLYEMIEPMRKDTERLNLRASVVFKNKYLPKTLCSPYYDHGQRSVMLQRAGMRNVTRVFVFPPFDVLSL